MENKEKLFKTILYVILVILIIAIILGMVYILTAKDKTTKEEKLASGIDYHATTEQNLNLVLAPLENHFLDSSNEKNLSYNIATLNGDFAYSVDYGCDTTNASLKFKNYISDQAMSVLINGYPNNTFEALGCINEDEAYLATQMAFWEVVNRTGESKKSTEIFSVKNITPVSAGDDSYNRIMEVAKRLVELAKTEPYSKVPTMHIKNGDVTCTVVDENAIIGPYTIEISDDAEFKTIKASLINAPASAKITDVNGTEKAILSNGDTVYVQMNKNENESTFNIKFEAFANRKVGAFFEGTNQTSQDYAKLYLVPINMEKELTIKWSKTTTLGRIELIVADKKNSPVTGSVFNLIDSNGNFIMEVKTGKDGVVDFYSVPEGDYTLEQISAPEGYEIKEKSKKVTIVAGELSTVRFEN